jgi:hypothetical protein
MCLSFQFKGFYISLVTNSKGSIDQLEKDIHTLLLSFPPVCPPHLLPTTQNTRFTLGGNILTGEAFLQKWTEYEAGKKKPIRSKPMAQKLDGCADPCPKPRGRGRARKLLSTPTPLIEGEEDTQIERNKNLLEYYEHMEECLEEVLQADIHVQLSNFQDMEDDDILTDDEYHSEADNEPINNCNEDESIQQEYLQAIRNYSTPDCSTVPVTEGEKCGSTETNKYGTESQKDIIKREKRPSQRMREWIESEEIIMDISGLDIPIKRKEKEADISWANKKKARLEEMKEDILLEKKMEK